MQAPVIPQTINRLFVTSMVLSGMVIITSIGTAYRAMLGTAMLNLALTIVSVAIVANHLILYHLAKKQAAPLSPSADGQVRYPNCLFGLPNIIFTALVAFIPLGFYWMPIVDGVTVTRVPSYISYTTPSPTSGMSVRYFYWERPALSWIIQGVVGYAECCVLIALFAMYVHQRKAHLKAVREGSFKA